MATTYIDSNGNLVTSENKKKKNTYTYIDDNGNLASAEVPNIPTTNKKKKKNAWINLTAFDDGYDFGDITKSILGTSQDVGKNVFKGAMSAVEGINDFVAQGLGGAAHLIGAEKAAKGLRNYAAKDTFTNDNVLTKTILNSGFIPGGKFLNIADELTGQKGSKFVTEQMNKNIEKTSVLGDSSRGIAQGVGQLGGQVALQSLGVPWQVTAFTGAASNEIENAFQNDSTYGQAFTSGLISGLSEVGSEYLSGGANKFLGMTSLGSKFIDKLGGKITNKALSRGLKTILDVGGEGGEEIISGLGTAIGRKLTYMSDKDFKEIYSSEQALDDFIGGALVTAIAGVPGNVRSIARGENAFTGLTANEQKVIDKEIQNRIEEKTKDSKELSKKEINEIEDQVRKDMEKGRISVETIEEVLDGDNLAQNEVIEKNSDVLDNINKNKKNNLTNNNFKKYNSDTFSKQIDEVINGTFNKNNHMTVLEHTPQVLQNLGVRDLPVTLTTSKLDRIMNQSGKQKGEYHGLKDLVRKLPDAIQNPLDIVKSHDNSYVLTTDLSDNQDRSVIVSLKIDGKGYIDNIDIDTNVMTSAYGRNNYDNWMKEHLKNGDIVYDVDRGYVNQSQKKDTIPGLQLPNNSINMDNNNINDQKSQIAPLSSQYNMQQQEDTIPIKEKIKNNSVSIPMAKNDNVLKSTAEDIAKQINKNNDFNIKQRSWTETSTESEPLKGKVFIEDLDPSKITYEVQSNKKSLDKANKHLDTYGYEKSLDYVKNLIQNEGLPKASDVALMQRMIQEASKRGDAETVQNLIMDTAILGTDLGQATQALSIIQRLTPEGQLKMYTKLVDRAKARGEKSFQNVEITPEMVQKILEAYNSDGTYDQKDLNARVESFKQDLANQMKSTTGEKIDTWRYLSMLGNPKTHIRNIVSNVAMTGTTKVKNAMARTLETLLPVKDRTKTWKKTSQEIKDYAARTTQEMKGIITGESKFNEKSSIESKKQIFKSKALEKISNLNSAALEVEDWMFSSRAFRSTFQEYLTANNINTMEDVKNNPEVIQKAKNYAVEQAQIATFRQYSKLAATINQLERKNKGARLAIEATVPFKKTPINVAKAGASYSPLGLIKNITYDAYQLKQGNINASQFIDNISQGLTGTSLTLLGYALAKAGILTGSGDDDKEGKYDSQLGNKGYSVNIGNKSYSISWLSPVAMPLLVGSNAYEQLEEKKDWDANVVSDSLAKTLDPLNEMSFMQGVTKALSSYDKGTQKLAGIGESFVSNYASQLFPTLFSQIASVTDDKKRSTTPSSNSKYRFGEQTARSLMYKVPGLRQQLEPVTDIWGNEKKQSENILERAFETFIAPYTKTEKIATELDDEIKRVYNEVGDVKVIPGIPNAYIVSGDETYRMSAKEYTEFKKTYGQTANEILNNLINSSEYENADDDDKAKMIEKSYEYARSKAKEEYFDKIDVDYEDKLLNKLETLNKEFNVDASDYIANQKAYDYAYRYPEKYRTITQIADYDDYIEYKDKIKDIRNNTSNDKEETIKYINSLKMSVPKKAMFIKQYYKSFNQYDNEIINYVNSQKMSANKKQQILNELGFTVRDGRVYYK